LTKAVRENEGDDAFVVALSSEPMFGTVNINDKCDVPFFKNCVQNVSWYGVISNVITVYWI